MIKNVHIPLGKVQTAYDLTDAELHNLIQTLWERRQLFPNELWSEAYENYWYLFAQGSLWNCQEKLPELPNLSTGYRPRFYSEFYGADVITYLTQLAKLVPYKLFRDGLDFLFDTAFEDGSRVAEEERSYLYRAFDNAEIEWRKNLGDFSKFPGVGPIQLWKFISKNIAGTLMADRDAVIEILCDYPLKREVKGLTRRVVDSTLDRLEASSTKVQLEIQPKAPTEIPTEASASCQPDPASSAPSAETIVVPSALWVGKSPAAVRDAMKEDFDECVTAHVLLNWCKVGKTQVGRLLSPKEFGDDKSYRNFVDMLMRRATRLDIQQD